MLVPQFYTYEKLAPQGFDILDTSIWTDLNSRSVGEAEKLLPVSEAQRLRKMYLPAVIAVAARTESERVGCRAPWQTTTPNDWLDRNAHQYEGQWVALDGSRLVACGDSARSVFDEARAAGVRVPFVHLVKLKRLPSGGL